MRTTLCTALICLLAPLSQLHAGHEIVATDSKKQVVPEDEFPFTQGTKEFSIGGAGFGSIGTVGDKERPDTGYAIGELRLGLMLTTPGGGGFCRGNFEVLLEAFGGDIFSGPGDGLVGSEILFRYNFVQPHAKLVPFFQIGGGGVWSDAAYANETQRLIGSRWSFNLEAEIGGRYMLSRNVSLNAGVEYRHISNADTASRNRGLNSLGGEMSISYFF